MITEIKEEIGLEVKKEELNLIHSGRSDETQVFLDIYYLRKDFDIKDLILQKEEVDFAKWYSIDEIKQFIQDELFFKNHEDEFF